MKILRDEKWRQEDRLMLKEGKVYVPKNEKLRAEVIRLHHDMLSCRTINFGNINDIWNLIIIINSSRERIGSPDITTRSPVVYSRALSK